ncbi:MAG: ribonuclease Z [Prevotellaceae bacterium]|jgi:ribonuclease Z|nr:ribonuclease Z [Prevotellaceae bacterium]MDY3855686.1 ribonuclease Z [Bacteroidaceae bacterium]
MEKFEVTILGCGSAVPTLNHNPSSQVVNVRDKLSIVDCGESTQLQLRKSKVRFMSVRNIFISHLHGDHCFGLLGLISTFGLLGRTLPLHVYAPAAYGDLLERQIDFFCQGLEFKVEFHPLDTEQFQVIYEDRSMTVSTLPLDHRVPCCGFLFREKPSLPHIVREMIDYYEIPISQINNIKMGVDWKLPDGTIIPNSRLTRPSSPPRSYAYCSDTAYKPDLVPHLRGVNLLYHEATFLENRIERARYTHHSTAHQAALIARDAHVGQLLIGHYSAHYLDEQPLLDEARQVFPNTIAAKEGMTVPVI